MKIEHVFFDLDHTLWDFDKNSGLTFEKIFKLNNVNIEIDDFLRIYMPINLEYWRLYRDEKVTKEALRYNRLKKSFDKLNFEISDVLIDKLAIDYIDNLSSFNYLFEGTFEILDYLKSKYQLHIITNGFDEVQMKKMTSSKIIDYFDAIITSDSVGVKKPNPKVFNFALKKANATAENSVMIGDSLEADINGALNVGFNVIHCVFNDETATDNNVTSVANLLEIKQYL